MDPTWRLKDVQAVLSSLITWLCAGAIFVFVRYLWLKSARRMLKQSEVKAHGLLSLNTIGEIIDITVLLQWELFNRRYLTLLLQCIFVALLTVATMMSGLLAGVSMRDGIVTRALQVNGSLAERATRNIGHADVDTNITMTALKEAKWPLTRLVEFLPNSEYNWDYIPEQWNGSWTVSCSYNRSVQISGARSTGDCTNLTTEVPQLFTYFWDWDSIGDDSWDFDTKSTNWGTSRKYRDWNAFSHGLKKTTWDEDLDTYTELEMRTIITYLSGVPNNPSDDSKCVFGEGPIDQAYYTSASCKLTRNTTGQTKDELSYGAYPDRYSVSSMATAYIEHWGNAFFRASSRHQTVPNIEAEDLVYFWISWLATKDIVSAPYVTRTINVRLHVPQVSVICLYMCSVAGSFVFLGLISYWSFIFTNRPHLHKLPQSKLDWMLMACRGPLDPRRRLDVVLGCGSEEDIGLGICGTDSDYSAKSPDSAWLPQKYEHIVPHTPQGL